MQEFEPISYNIWADLKNSNVKKDFLTQVWYPKIIFDYF